MKRLYHSLICLLLFISACKGPKKEVDVKIKKNSNNQYKDFACMGDSIWGLTTDGKLVVFDASNGDPISVNVKNDSAIIAIANDKQGNVIIGDKSKTIKKYNKNTQSWTSLFKFEHGLLAITFNSKNHCFLITNKGIYDNSTKKYYYPASSQNDQIRSEYGWLNNPALVTDKNDNIWIGFGFGEWGGELFIFNTINKNFIIPNLKEFPITLNPIKSIFESKENVFVTSGLMHFSTQGSIAEFNNFKATLIFESKEHKKFPNDDTNTEFIYGEYIGPGAYNEKDECIYFYSQNGIFKGNPENKLSTIEDWEKVLEPKLHWRHGQPDAVGSPMNMLKLRFVNPDRLIFVSQDDGIGIYDGKTLILTQ